MATISLSGLITSIKGSIGGTTFQRSGSGLTARNKPVPLKSKTNQQTQVRVLQARLNKEWLNLTAEQRQTWQSFAEYTNGYGLTNRRNSSSNTGKMQFLTVNFWILLYGKPLLSTPTFQNPLDPCIPCPPFFDYTDNLFNYDGSLDVSQEILVTRVSLPQSLATRTANTGFRTLVYNQVNGSEQDWAQAYIDTYGVSLQYNKKYWIELQKVNFLSGSISTPARKLVRYYEPDNSLKLVVDTTKSGSASNTFVLKCGNVGIYNAVIYWGDGSMSLITSWNDADLTHVYTTPGVYTISITNVLPWINFAETGDRLKVIDILQFGVWQPSSMASAFAGCANLVGTAVDALDLSNCTSLNQAFRSCSNLVLDVSGWNTGTITNMQLCFYQCIVFNGDVESWNVSNVTTMSNMFFGCAQFNRNLSLWNTGACSNMMSMFGACTLFNSSIGGWNVSAVTSMNSMFSGCTAFNQDISTWSPTALTTATSFMVGTSFNITHYNAVLNAWAALTLVASVNISFGSTQYSIAVAGAARTTLVSAPNNWVITDGGGI